MEKRKSSTLKRKCDSTETKPSAGAPKRGPSSKAAQFPAKKRIKVESSRGALEGNASPADGTESTCDQDFVSKWQNEDAVAEVVQVSSHIAKNVIKLLDEDCTVPFIVRYRKEITGNLPPEKIREIQLSYENVKTVRKKVNTILKTISSSNVDAKVITALKYAKTLDEVEYLYAPLKPGSKRTLAERAKSLGLESLALTLLDGRNTLQQLQLDTVIDPNIPGKTTLHDIRKGIQSIIADIIAKDMEILDFIRNHPARECIQFSSKKSATAKKEEKKAYVEGKDTKTFKFENYFDFTNTVGRINSHQVMAINRGEGSKVLTVKLIVPPRLSDQMLQKCRSRFPVSKIRDADTLVFYEACVKDAYDRLLEPHLCRQMRSDLTKKAAIDSTEIFCSNLKRLLLTPPVRGEAVIGVDPGFKHGCKLAAVSCAGEVFETGVVYPHCGTKFSKDNDYIFIKMVLEHNISLIAIGNGTACRETETWVSGMIQSKAFHPRDVRYCIVDESGVSIYSVSKESELEHPGMDPNVRSAISIARRLQDPLLEYVKVEPKHLGVGMYQHDVPDTMLKSALDGVVVECVSFVGVDLNVCPEVLLRKISGLSSSKAKKIIEWREQHGCFVNVHQLLEVKGLGPKSFEQCAGFVKVLPQTALKKNSEKESKKKPTPKSNPLDMTIIHPESYDLAEKFLVEIETGVDDIGKQSLTEKVKNYLVHRTLKEVSLKFNVAEEQMKIIIDAFLQQNFDIRDELGSPLFKTGISSLVDLVPNQELTGRVTNVTNFGAFVDVGVGQAGLVHVSQMRNCKLQLGDRVNVRVLSVDVAKKRIALQLLRSAQNGPSH